VGLHRPGKEFLMGWWKFFRRKIKGITAIGYNWCVFTMIVIFVSGGKRLQINIKLIESKNF
jgi:hypothetical protein